MKTKRPYIIFSVIVILLLIPLIAMQFTSEVNWTTIDFVIAGILLLGVWLIFETIVRLIKNKKFQIALIVALFIVFILVWIELAVGIFGSPFAGS